MSDEVQQNPYAFPCKGGTGFSPQQGMTLRDWFAGQALPVAAQWQQGFGYNNELTAERAYAMADAMLKHRLE